MMVEWMQKAAGVVAGAAAESSRLEPQARRKRENKKKQEPFNSKNLPQ